MKNSKRIDNVSYARRGFSLPKRIIYGPMQIAAAYGQAFFMQRVREPAGIDCGTVLGFVQMNRARHYQYRAAFPRRRSRGGRE